MRIRIEVRGTPAPQGSKKFVGLSKAGRGLMVESSKAVKPWREAVKWAAMDARAGNKAPLIEGPVIASIVFTVRKAASAPKRRKTWPDRKPDIDKLCRSTLDSLVESGIIEDDARVVSLIARKVFPNEGEDSLAVPGAIIRVTSARLEADAKQEEGRR